MCLVARNLYLIAPLFLFACIALFSLRAEAAPYSGLVVDVDSDRALYERNADELRHPASLTKMMTLYLVFEALANGELFPDTLFRASRFAVLRPPSRLGLAAGDTLTVEDGILALVTRSANDAASVIAEGMAGSESAFAELMTEKARQLGMGRTLFRNASGLPDPNQVTTAWDMYRLGKALNRNFPQYYTYFSTPRFYYGGQSFQNHNHLMETYPGMDGIKTGFVNASGFNLVASARRNGRRLIGVVFGGPSAQRRDAHMREILNDGFAQLEGEPPRVAMAEFERPEPLSLLARPRWSERPRIESPEIAQIKRTLNAGGRRQLHSRKVHGRGYVHAASAHGRGKQSSGQHRTRLSKSTASPSHHAATSRSAKKAAAGSSTTRERARTKGGRSAGR
jgi:D-alanyl-D-alanine carboxypeptidase